MTLRGLFKNGNNMSLFKKISQYFKEAKVELKKVAWPTKQETLKYSFLVLFISLLTALYFLALDFIFAKGLEILINR